MKIKTDYDKEKGLFILPVFAIGYQHEDRELYFVFIFACWMFSIEFTFK